MYFIDMNLIYILSIILLMNFKLFSLDFKAGAFTMTRLHYSGGGDWYADPSSIPNLLFFLERRFGKGLITMNLRSKLITLKF